MMRKVATTKSSRPLIIFGLSFLGVFASCANPDDIEGSYKAGSSNDGPELDIKGDDGRPRSEYPLGLCEGDCDNNAECLGDLVCFKRNGYTKVPGCSGEGERGRDYCIEPESSDSDDSDDPSDGSRRLELLGDEDDDIFPLGRCQGDCDNNNDCAGTLRCYKRDGFESVPGCSGSGTKGRDYCFDPDDDGNDDGNDDDNDTHNGNGDSNLQVKLNGRWRGVCCVDGDLELSNESCEWEERQRYLLTHDVETGQATKLDCPERTHAPDYCECSNSGEAMHGIRDGNVHVSNSLSRPNGAPIYPNSAHEVCVDMVDGELATRWSSDSCPPWRLTNFY